MPSVSTRPRTVPISSCERSRNGVEDPGPNTAVWRSLPPPNGPPASRKDATMPALTGVHHVALTVTDVERSVPWYERVLGFTTIGRDDEEEFGLRKVFLRGPGFGLTLTLVQHPAGGGALFDERQPGLDHSTFTVPSANSLR